MIAIIILLWVIRVEIVTRQTKNQLLGGDIDTHGCLPSAGYQWCPSSQKCQRMWEEYCPEFADVYVNNFDKCIEIGMPAMESYPRQCRFKDKTFTEQIEPIQ